MFQGATSVSVDTKGRIAIPARYRDVLTPDGASLVMTAHPHRCAMVYPQAGWEPIRDKINALPSLDARSATIKRMIVGFASEETLDSAGRVLVPASLRQFAGLDKTAWLVGQGTHFELWSEQGWARQQEAMFALAQDVGELPHGMGDLVL